jgi:hypothetical protein
MSPKGGGKVISLASRVGRRAPLTLWRQLLQETLSPLEDLEDALVRIDPNPYWSTQLHLAIRTLGALHLEAGTPQTAFTIGLFVPFSSPSE